MTTIRSDSKGVQTDPDIQRTRSKLLKTLQTYVTVVSRYRLYLFNQYINQSNESYQHQDLLNVRKEILNRFQLVISELERAIEHLQTHRLSVTDVQQIIDRSLVKEVIETSLNADLPSVNDPKQVVPDIDKWRMYRRGLQETKEDLSILNLLVHRGISKIDRLMNATNLCV